MITLRLDKKGGINRGDINMIETDNKSDVYIIQLYKGEEVYNLTGKTVELSILEKKRGYGDTFDLPIYEATTGKIKLEVLEGMTKTDGLFYFQITVKDSTGLVDNFPIFPVEIKNSLKDDIIGTVVNSPYMQILLDAVAKAEGAVDIVNDIKTDYDTAKTNLQANYTQTKTALQKDYDTTKTSLQTDYVAIKNNIQSDYNATKTNIQNDYNSLRKVIMDENASAELQGQINDINSDLDNKTNYEYVNNQISIAQLEGASIDTTSFLTRSDLDYLLIKSINKFNPKNLTNDKYLVRGVLTDYVGWNTTEFIRIQGKTMSCKIFKTEEMGTYVKGEPNTWVEVNNVYFAFYDSLYQYITGGSADTGSYLNQVSIPNNAKFIRFAQSNKLLNDTSTLMFAFSDLSDLKTIDDYQKYCIELEGSDYIREEEFNQSIENVNKNIESVNINIKNVKDALSRSVTVKSINRLGYDVYNPLTPPEHSLEGYTLALEKGFDEILCDLRSTSDSYPICLHDTTINRTARNTDGTTLPTTNILDITYKQANSYDYGLYKNKKYKGTKLLTLERAVKFAKMNGVTLHIETKCGTSKVELKMIENAVRTVKKYNMSKFVSWSATYGKIAVLQKIISLDKYANVAIMPDTMTNERFEALLKLKTGFNKVFWFAWETSTIDDDMLNRFINNEVGLEIGTLNSSEEMKKLFDSNLRYVTAISSDKLVARECLK